MRMEPPISEPLASAVVPGSQAGAGAAGGAAAGIGGVPGRAGDAVDAGMGIGGAGELRRRRARMHDRARLEQPADRGIGLIRNEVLVDQRPEGHALALDEGFVLDGDGQALQRPRPAVGLAVLLFGLLRLRQRPVIELQRKGVDLLLHLFRAVDHRLHEFHRRQRLGLEAGNGLGRRQIAKFKIGHQFPRFIVVWQTGVPCARRQKKGGSLPARVFCK